MSLLQDGPGAGRMREIREHLDETWCSGMGGLGVGDLFYHRLQSPVLIAEPRWAAVAAHRDTPLSP